MENHIPNFGAYGYVEPNKNAITASNWNWPLTFFSFTLLSFIAWLIYLAINDEKQKAEKPLPPNDESVNRKDELSFRKIE